MGIMVPLVIFIVVTLLIFVVGCFIVGSVVVEARRAGRPLLPEDPRPAPAAEPARAEAPALAIPTGRLPETVEA